MTLGSYRISLLNRLFGGAKARNAIATRTHVILGDSIFEFADGGEWTVSPCWFWKKIEFKRVDVRVCHFILNRKAAEEFLAKIALCELGFQNQHAVEAVLALKPRWSQMTAGKCYIPRHEVDAFAKEFAPLIHAVPPSIGPLLSTDPSTGWSTLVQQLQDPVMHVEQANDIFVTKEIERLKNWFRRLSGPPTLKQREIAVRDETNSLVVAGAGTGKTSTILTKILYLVHAQLAAPVDILVVAFNRDAAQEIRDRCEAQGISGLSVETFHALGLKVLGEAEGEKPAMLSQLESDQGRDELVSKLLSELCEDTDFAEAYARFIVLYARPSFSPNGAKSKDQHVRQSKAFLTKSLRGEWVRSTEELRIANWLFAHGIHYVYEGRYATEVSTPARKQYRPDFTITFTVQSSENTGTERTVYLEHQALDEAGKPPSWMEGYAEKVRWARNTHQSAGTVLVESFSWWFRKGDWEKRLAKTLADVGVPIAPPDWRSVLSAAEKSAEEAMAWERKSVLGLFRRGIDLVRTTASDSDSDGEDFLRSALDHRGDNAPSNDASRVKLFDSLFIPLYRRYEEFKRSRGGIDFEDMIFRARQRVEAGQFNASWSHYIVDEFQDASLSRLNLILAMRAQRPDSRLLCVGDDWQSIIRFAGSDIRVMTQFDQWVGSFWRSDLDLTFRSSANISALAQEFVLKNPSQLRKDVKPAINRRNLPIRILFHKPIHSSDGEGSGHKDILFDELAKISEEFKNASVLVLSRYRRGVPQKGEQEAIGERFPSLDIKWSTAHASKGREADAVIVGDLDDSPFGFPCLREDDPLIVRLLPPEEAYPSSEERRLFYVAMTRAKERLVLIANAQQPSPFVLELLELRSDANGLEVERDEDTTFKQCPSCNVGTIVARDGANGRFYSCTKSPVCSHTEEACSKCRRGFLIARDDNFVCSNRACGHQTQICPKCRRGWLQEKTNRQNGNVFFGCSRFRDEDSPCTYTQSTGPRKNWQANRRYR